MKVTADHSRKRRGEWLQREGGGGGGEDSWI